YLLLAEFAYLDDASITAFLNAAERLDNLPTHYLRGNGLGTFRSGIGLWQIVARQNQIPRKDLNAAFQRIIAPFDKVAGSSGVFDAGRSSLRELMVAATGRPEASQGELIDLLAGRQQSTPEGQRRQQVVAMRMRSVLDAQRLVSLDTL